MNINSRRLHTSIRARRRTRTRYRAQNLLKLAGMAAIGFAALALATLLYTIVSRATLALNETYITLDIHLDEKRIDPDGKRDPDVLYKASYSKLVKTRLRQMFPGLGRSEKRKLYALVSDAASYELRDYVVENPSLIGTRITFDFLADDDVDLFIKGRLGKVELLDVGGPAHISGVVKPGEQINIHFPANPLDAGLDLVKRALGKRAGIIERQAEDQLRALRSTGALVKLSHDEAEIEKLFARKAQYENRYQTMMSKVKQLRHHEKRSGGMEVLDPTLPSLFLKINDGMIKVNEIEPDRIRGNIVLPLSSLQAGAPGEWALLVVATPEDNRKITDKQIIWLEKLKSEGRIKQTFNWHLFTSTDASEPEEAGILGGLMGTFWTMLVTFVLSFPVGVMSALYLEEFAPKNAVTRFVEVNINNLAAVPSIVFGLLGLAVFVNFFGMPYSSSLVGGIVLSLMTLPTVIIASRAAIRAVPPSIREAALGIGASKMQTVFQHVLPLAMPGIMTGSIIGMAQALGETAPLLMIGMVAFIVDPPMAVTDAASSLPVLIYLWSDRAELAFDMRTASAILVLLFFLVVMNGLAILLRKRFERRW